MRGVASAPLPRAPAVTAVGVLLHPWLGLITAATQWASRDLQQIDAELPGHVAHERLDRHLIGRADPSQGGERGRVVTQRRTEPFPEPFRTPTAVSRRVELIVALGAVLALIGAIARLYGGW
jgi:hypothetical protein